MKNNIQNKIIFFLIVFISILQTSCNYFKDKNAVVFKSDVAGIEEHNFNESADRSSLSKEWSVSDSRIECLVSNENTKLKLMTRELGSQKGTLEMTVRVGFFNKAISEQNNNWAGFSISPKEKILNNKKCVKLNADIKIGVCTNGALFIGVPSPNHINQAVINALPNGLDLKIVVTPIENYYAIDFSTFDASTGEILANISKNYITKDRLMGQLELVSNFESLESGKVNDSKSVWFEDWIIKGTKVIRL